MKFTIIKGNITLTSESDDEALTLFKVATSQVTKGESVKDESSCSCDVCGATFKNARGVRTHKSHIHRVKSSNTEQNRRYYLRTKARKARQQKALERKALDPMQLSLFDKTVKIPVQSITD